MTNREIISSVLTGVRENGSDSILFNKYIYTTLFRKAIVLMKRDTDQKRNIYMSSSMWGEPVNIEMEEVNILEDTCLCIPINCPRYRSKKKLGDIIETGYGFMFQYISSPDNSVQFRYTTPSSYQTKSKIKYNKTKYAFIENDYLYTPNAEFPCLKVVGMFNALEGSNCSRLDNNFPCPEYLIDFVVKDTIQELLIGKQLPVDPVNNKNVNNTI